MNSFEDFPCNHCGWCCQRTPCPTALYLGEKPLSPCSHLTQTQTNEFKCGLILNELDEVKLAAIKELILAGTGCSHKFGPSPISLMRQLVEQGLDPNHTQWQAAKENTLKEYGLMMDQANELVEKKSIQQALIEFEQFCENLEAQYS